MKIKDGGATENISGNKIESIHIVALEDHRFELWVNDSLSYITITEFLELKADIQRELEKSIK